MKRFVSSISRLILPVTLFSAAPFLITTPAPAQYQITGTVAMSGSPIAGVGVSAYTINLVNGTNYQTPVSNTDSNGFYVVNVSNGVWGVMVNNSLNSLGYNFVNAEYYVVISGANGTANFSVPPFGTSELSGCLTDTYTNPIPNVTVYATTTSQGLSNQVTSTDNNGFYQFDVQDGEWDVSVNCTTLTNLGFECVGDQNVGVGNGENSANNDFQAVHVPYMPFFDNQASLGNTIYYLAATTNNPFGYYSLAYYPYVYHVDLGFEYFFDAQNSTDGAYLYDFTSGHFWYTSPTLFPYLYDFTLTNWLYYFPVLNGNGTQSGYYYTNPRIFHEFNGSPSGTNLFF